MNTDEVKNDYDAIGKIQALNIALSLRNATISVMKATQDHDEALLRQALEALDDYPYMSNKDDHDNLDAVIKALRERLGEKG